MRFSSRIVVLDAGHTIAEGTPEEIVRNSAVEKAYLGA
jgi:branched-chain amino acid transport system ATP-binding protein